MKLNDLHPPVGSKKTRMRVGRGPGSGNGKTSGKGHKGQLSRAGGGKGPGFEGGQMPLQRRLPKRGFTNVLRLRWVVVNVADLARLTEDRIDPGVLVARGLVKGRYDGIKILGEGELTRPLQVQAHAISAGARQKIEGAGGSFEVISR